MRSLIFFLALIFLSIGFFYIKSQKEKNIVKDPINTSNSTQSISESPEKIKIVAKNLDTPWALIFLPGNSILVTERSGRVRLIENNTLLDEPVAVISSAKEIGEGGLLGMALHPDFSSNGYVYLYYTYKENNSGTLNRVVRMTYKNKKLSDETIVVDAIPGASNHNGGRIKFGPDNFLYIATGDAQEPSQAQDKNSLAGKILRTTDGGKPAPGNPFNSLVFSYGHRNPQGLAWDSRGRLWSTEHGRSGLQSGLDEINLIESGKNYGWPEIQGDEKKAGMISPVIHSGSDTWAPAGASIINDSLFFAGLRGSALYKYGFSEKRIIEQFKNEFGRIRDVIVGSDGMLYITTSNLDGRGTPKENDDKIIRIDPSQLP